METYVIRLDLEVKTKDQDGAGEMINQITEVANDVVDLEHYRWALVQTDEGLDDPDLEKLFAKAEYQ